MGGMTTSYNKGVQIEDISGDFMGIRAIGPDPRSPHRIWKS